MASDTTDAAYTEACALLTAGNICRAIDALTAAVEEEPDEGRLWALLGIAQWGVGAVTDSIASLETALTLAPLGVEGHDGHDGLPRGFTTLRQKGRRVRRGDPCFPRP